MKDIRFFRIDELESQFNVVKVTNDTSEILFEIPKSIKDAKIIAKHVTNSVKRGDMGEIVIGFKRTDPDGNSTHFSETINASDAPKYLDQCFGETNGKHN